MQVGNFSNGTDVYDTFLNSSLQNKTSSTNNTERIPYELRPETYFVPVLFFVIFVIGVVGNGTLVVIFIRHSHMRNVPNTYILSLALADLLVIISSVPFTSIVYTVESWPWGELICKISETTKDVSVAVSVFTLTALSADRFFAIVDPLKKFHTGASTRRATHMTLCVAILIWVLAIICALPAAIGSHIKGIPEENAEFFVCYPFPVHWLDHQYPKVMVMSKFLILYIIPLTIIAIFYLSMAMSLISSTKNAPGEIQGMLRQIQARKKVAVTVLIFVVVFAVCFAPLHAFMLFFYFNPRSEELYNEFWHYLRIVGFCLAYLNSCANPVALYFVSGVFRKHFNRYLLCRKVKKTRCNTYQQPNLTTSSLVSMKRKQSITSRKESRKIEPVQETAIALLGNGLNNAKY